MNELILTRYNIEPDIIISEDCFFTLSIENKGFLLDVLSEFRYQIEDQKEGDFHLLLNDKTLNISKSTAVIFDFTDIDFNAKNITNLLAKKFAEFLGLGEQAASLINLESLIFNLAEDFRIKSGLNIEYDTTMNVNNITKVCSLKIADYKGTLLERLCEYVNLLCDLKPLKLLILPFGKSFLDKNDIENLQKYCFDKQVRLLFVEGTNKTELLKNERRLVVDADLCMIIQGYEEFDY